jgi:hypothetical protein
MADTARYANPDFVYMRSSILNQVVAYSKKTGWAYCETDKTPDGKPVAYSPKELDILNAGGRGVLPLSAHRVKKIFGGEIV